eukprot:5370219-Prymnesium_polylepis.1
MGWPLDASRGSCHRSSRSPEPYRLVLRSCVLPLLCFHDTEGLDCGPGRHRCDARCTLITRSPCRGALRGRRAAANFGSSER